MSRDVTIVGMAKAPFDEEIGLCIGELRYTAWREGVQGIDFKKYLVEASAD